MSGELFGNACLKVFVVSRALLSLQPGAPVEERAHELGRGSFIDFSVHKVAGVIVVEVALRWMMRWLSGAHAYAIGEPLSQFAGEVVDMTCVSVCRTPHGAKQIADHPVAIARAVRSPRN